MEQLTENNGQSVFPQENSTEEYSRDPEAMHDQLNAARRDWAAVSAKRQRRLFDRTIHGYNAAQEKYENLVVECQKLDLEEDLAAEPDEMQRRLMTAEYWLNEQNLLREETKNTVEGKKTWKFAHAFSEFLNSGSPRMRMLKGIALGVGVGVAGSMIGGVLGAATIGTGIVAAGRFARGYFARHKGGIDQHDVVAEDMLQQIGGEDELDDATFETALRKKSSEMFERDGKKEQNKQRIAFAWGAGSVAVGAAFGWAAASGHWGFLPGAHAETISHHDVTTVADGHADTASVEAGHHDITRVETGHADTLTAASGHHDVTAVAHGHADTSAVESGHHDVTTVSDRASTAEIGKSDEFMVEKGSGIIREIDEYAEHLGYKDVSRGDASRMYEIILKEHGKNGIIDVHGIDKDTYLFGHDVRISAPGEANWRSGVSEDLQRLFRADASGHKLSTSILHGHEDLTNVGGTDLPNATAADISHAGHVDVANVEGHNVPNVAHINTPTTGSADLPNATTADIRHADAGTLNIRHSVVAEAEQIIRQAANNPANVVSNTETWYHTFGELNKAGLTITRESYGKLLKVVGPELAKLNYTNTIPVAYYDDYAQQWTMNQAPDGHLLPAAAIRLIAKHLTKDGYVLTA